MLHFRCPLLSHLPPSLLTKMSVAILATFSAAGHAADNLATVSANMVTAAQVSNTMLSLDMLPGPVLPDTRAAAGASFSAVLHTRTVLARATNAIPTLPQAQSGAAREFAVVMSSQIVSATVMKASGDLDALLMSSINEVASLTMIQVGQAFAELASNASAASPNDPMTVRAEQMTGRPQRVINFDGQVELVRGPSTIDARTAEYHGVEDLVMAKGNVQMFRNRDCYTGDILEMQMDTGQGFLINPEYRLEKNNAQGYAKRMNFIDSDRSEIEEGMYTTCQGVKPDWYMLSHRLDLDSAQDEGTAYNGVVYFKEVPILAAPWLSFPISDARRSGLLPPEFYTTTTGGPEITTPYYFNIAPNRDLTVYPTYIEKRGAELGADFRYLDTSYSGTTHFEITPSDANDNGAARYSIGALHNQTLAPGLSMAVNYNRASDNQYAVDYSHSITESSRRLLPQTFALNYGHDFWNVGLNLSNYQVLQDANNDIGTPYAIRPKLFAGASKINGFGGFDWSVYGEYANFTHPTLVNGERVTALAQISYPISGTSYFVTPKVMYHLSEYALGMNLTTGNPASPVLAVPTFSLDSGLFFERSTSLMGYDLTQTLEPRLFYVRTPYRDQTAVPLFDTGISDINFAQIFNENRFSGQDRVGDANQLTSALISRAIEMNGQERMRFALAERISFQQPRVVDATSFTPISIYGLPSSAPISTLLSRNDLIFAATSKLTNTLSLQAGWQYSQTFQNTQQLNYGFQWKPGPNRVLNLEYRFNQTSEVEPEGMKQLNVSAQWPLAPRWYGIARSNFSIQDHRILDGLFGFEYRQDCWIFRAVAQRYLVPSTIAGITSSSTTSLFFQLELNGLSKIGSNPLEVLRRSIAGYQPLNQPVGQRGYQPSND